MSNKRRSGRQNKTSMPNDDRMMLSIEKYVISTNCIKIELQKNTLKNTGFTEE